MPVIYQTNPGQLIAQPGRAVSTFLTGLVRVDQTYICATLDADGHRAALFDGAPMPDGNSKPCLDGCYISPIPGEIERGDGFTEFKVSGYGRSTLTASSIILIKKPLSTYKAGVFGGYVSYMVYEASGTACVFDDGNLTYEDLGFPEDFLAPFDMRYNGAGTGWVFKKLEIGIISNRMQFEDVVQDLPNGAKIRVRIWRGASPSRSYLVTFERPGSPDVTNEIPIIDPVLTITSRSKFGKFSEVVFTAVRNKSEGL